MNEEKQLTYSDEFVWEELDRVMNILRLSKPADRSERARRFSVTITEMEKVIAYFRTYVFRQFDNLED